MTNATLTRLSRILISLPAKIIAGVFVFYLAFSYFAVNPLAKHIIPWVAENKLASHANVGKVEFDPFQLKATIENFKLTEKNGNPLADFDKLVVDLELSGIFDWAWKFKEISITAPRANIAISSQGKLNWADLIDKLNEDKTPPSKTIPRIEINHIVIVSGNVEYVDTHRATPFKSSLSPLNFELDDFSTLPKDRGDYLLVAKLPDQGGSLKWNGSMGVNPIASKGAISIGGIKLAKLLQVVKDMALPFQTTTGDIQGNFSYDFSLSNDQPKVALKNITLSLNNLSGTLFNAGALAFKQAVVTAPSLDFSMPNKSSQVQFQDMRLKISALNLSKGSEPLLFLPALEANQIAFNLVDHHVKIAEVLLPNGVVNAAIDQSRALNWQQAFADSRKSANTAPADQVSQQAQSSPLMLDIDDIQLQHWHGTFLDQGLAHPLQVGIADFNLSFALNAPQGQLEISKLESNFSNLEVLSTLYKTPVASLEKFTLNQGAIKLANQRVDIEKISFSGFKSTIIKEAGKPLNWQQILEPVSGAANSNSTLVGKPSNRPNNSPDWAVSLRILALDNANVHIEDRSQTIPAIVDIEKALFEAHDTSLDLTRAIPVKATFQVKQGGQFNMQGKLTPAPFKANMNFKLTDFTLKPFSAYINQYALLKISDGALDLSGNLVMKNNPVFSLAFKGGFGINQFALVEETGDAPFLGWDRVGSDSLEVSLTPNLVHMTELQITKPTGKFIIHEDKSMNITRILRNQPVPVSGEFDNSTKDQKPITPAVEKEAATTASIESDKSVTTMATQSAPADASPNHVDTMDKATDKTQEAFPVNIESVRVENAELDFADLSLNPQFGTHINSLSGVINGVSTNAASVAQVEMDGKVDEYGSASIRGSIQPFKATNFTDLKLSFKNLEMNRLTPYSGKFAGRRIDSGKLSVDLEYKIKQRQLAGENKFIINKLKLGEKVDSKEAANLPLDLAIAILEDSDGVIDLDLPISGSLDDPKFSYGSVVWKAIKNVLSKIVTAPFRALGKLFGGSGDKLEAISFDAGSIAVTPPEQEKLKSVSQVLGKRPGLSLGIAPTYDMKSDARAVQELTLRKQVAQELGIKLDHGQQPGPIDLSNPKTQKVIDDLYDTLTKKGLLKKLASKLEKPKAGHFEEAQEKLTNSIIVTELDLQNLAKSRGEAIRNHLITMNISPDRVHVNAPVKIDGDGKLINTKLVIDVLDVKSKAVDSGH